MCTDQDRRGLRVGHGDWYRPASPELPATACSGPTLQEMATAIDTALASGRLDERQLLARAARVRRLTRPLPAPPEDLPGFVAEPDQIGLGAARHVFDSTGLIRVEGSITLVDLRIRTGHAGGLASHGYAEAFARARPVTAADLDAGAQFPLGTTPMALVQLPRADQDQEEALQALLRTFPETAMIHTEVAAGAPTCPGRYGPRRTSARTPSGSSNCWPVTRW